MDLLKRPEGLPLVDLRKVTRDSDRSFTRVSVVGLGQSYLWLQAGALCRLEMGSRYQWLGCRYVRHVRDEEGDAAYAFRFDVIGAKVEDISDGAVRVSAWMGAEYSSRYNFCVPSAMPDLKAFPRLAGGDRKAPFTSEADVKLWKMLRGCKLEIDFGPVLGGEE